MILCHITWGDSPDIYIESVFSILTFLPDPAVEKIRVLTERPEYYRLVANRIEIALVDEKTFTEWGGTHNFTFRKKIKGIEKLVSLGGGGDILYIDTDTFHGGDLTPVAALLKAGNFCMGDAYGRLAKAKDKGNRRVYSSLKGKNLFGHTVGEHSLRFNAGTIGLPASRAEKAIADVLEMSDAVYELTDRYVGSEEVAFGLALGKQDEIKDIGAIVGHYWGHKAEWRVAIREFLANHAVLQTPLDEMIAAVRAFDFKRIPTYTHKAKRRRMVERWTAKLWPNVRTRHFPEQPEPW